MLQVVSGEVVDLPLLFHPSQLTTWVRCDKIFGGSYVPCISLFQVMIEPQFLPQLAHMISCK